MRRPVDVAIVICERVNQAYEIRDVGGELARTGAADTLLDLGPGQDPRRPWHRRVEGKPLHDRALKGARRRADALVTDDHSEPVAQMAHHFVGRHLSPLPRAVGTDCPQAYQQRSLVARARQSLHRAFRVARAKARAKASSLKSPTE